MRITVVDRGLSLRDRLAERLARAALLRCEEHQQSIVAVTVHGREHGWFDSSWTTCCEKLERAAHAVLKERC